MSTEEERLVESLYQLGLTQNEAKVYVALVKYGQLDAKAASEQANVPQSKIYGVFDSLHAKKLVETSELLDAGKRRSKIVKAVNVGEGMATLAKRWEEDYNQKMRELEYTEQTLEKLQGTESEDVPKQEFWTIRGYDRILGVVRGAIRLAEDRILCTGSPTLLKDIHDDLLSSKGRGVQVRVTISEEESQEYKESLLALGESVVVIDFEGLNQILPSNVKRGNSVLELVKTLFAERPNFIVVDYQQSLFILPPEAESGDGYVALQIVNPRFVKFQGNLVNHLWAIFDEIGRNQAITKQNGSSSGLFNPSLIQPILEQSDGDDLRKMLGDDLVRLLLVKLSRENS